MPVLAPITTSPGNPASGWQGLPWSGRAVPNLPTPRAASLRPNALVRWAFYLSVFCIPFSQLYLPGTGGRVGVLRIAQMVMLAGLLSQPRVCLRLFPIALFWFLGYLTMRMLWGLWFTPRMAVSWWPNGREFLEFLFPWLWLMFNVLQFPGIGRGGLWALVLGCSLCAACHIAGIGAMEVADEPEDRSSVFGINANELGAAYATAMTASIGLWLGSPRRSLQRWLPFVSVALVGIGMAKTGSRTAILMLGIGLTVLMLLGGLLASWPRRVGGLAVLGLLLGVTLWRMPAVMERFGELNVRNAGEHNPRARMVPVLWEMFLRRPIYGSGPDSYQPELTRRAMPYLIRQQRLIASHNLALLLLVETGLIGFFLFYAGLMTALAAAWRARLKPCGPLPLALLLPFVIAGATVCNPSHHMTLWVAVAYALAGVC